MEEDIGGLKFLKESLVDFSVSEKYIENIKEYNENILDIISR